MWKEHWLCVMFAFLRQYYGLLLQVLEASWLKLGKSAAKALPGTPDRSGDHSPRQHLSEGDRFGSFDFAWRAFHYHKPRERLIELARSKARRRLVAAIKSDCRSELPSIRRVSEASERNVGHSVTSLTYSVLCSILIGSLNEGS